MLELRHLSIISGAFQLSDMSLSVAKGEYVTLMGRTGQGKTTILEAIAGLRKITSGEVHIDGQNVTRCTPAQRGVGYVPQDLALFPTMTVWENLAFALQVRGVEKSAVAKRVASLADWLGLSALLQRSVTTLSGGEAQRTALGRALSFEPKVLLLDEPFSALDDTTREDMHQLMRSIRQHTGVSVLHVTHSKAESIALADRVLRLHDGGMMVEE